jgi:hypothetical protein
MYTSNEHSPKGGREAYNSCISTTRVAFSKMSDLKFGKRESL